MLIKELVAPYKRYKNVIGHSSRLFEVPEKGEVLRIYVQKKEELRSLNIRNVLPEFIEDIPVEVRDVGFIQAGGPEATAIPNDGRRDKIRPDLMSGISVGNASITAGTQGVPAIKTGEEYYCSNAHVLTDNPSWETSGEVRILQQGSHDGGSAPADIVGYYHWHDRIFPKNSVPSKCPNTRAVIWAFNKIAGLNWRSRIESYVIGDNHQDFSAYKPVDGIGFDLRTFDFEITNKLLRMRVFAGSTLTSICCKLEYQTAAGYIPVVPYDDSPVAMDEMLRKSGRTTGDTQATIIDTSASIDVNYGDFTATFDDIVLTTKFVEGGDSGSDVWTIEE